MTQNNNKKPVRRMAVRSLKAHPFRAFGIALTIFLSSCLMTALPLLNTFSFIDLYRDMTAIPNAAYMNLTQKQLSSLEQNPYFVSVIRKKESSILRADTEYVRLLYAQSAKDSSSAYSLLEGTLPKALDEAAIEETLAAALQLGIGDRITCSEPSGAAQTFSICGTVKSADLTSLPAIYVSETYAENGHLLSHLPLSLQVTLNHDYLKNPEKSELLLHEIGVQNNVAESDLVIQYDSLYRNPITLERMIVYLLLDAGCLLVAILVIYSIFYISVMSRISEFGQLSTLGMSRRQLRKMMNCEGHLLCLSGILPGILVGSFLAQFFTGTWSFGYVLFFAVWVFLLSYLVIMVCLQKPVRIASSISPVDAQTYDPFHHPTAHGTNPHTRLTPRRLAKLRFQKERKKTFFTILSMLLGGTLFLLGATYIFSADTEKMARQAYFQDAEYVIQYSSEYQTLLSDTELFDFQRQNILNEELIQELYEIPEVEHITALHSQQIEYDCEGGSVTEEISMITEDMFPEITKNLQECSIEYETLVRENGVIYTGLEFYGEIPFSAGDLVTFRYYNGEQYLTKEVRIAAVADPVYSDRSFIQGGFLVPKELMEELFPGINTTSYLLVQTKQHVSDERIDTAVKRIVSHHDLISVETFTDYQKEILRQNQILAALIFCGSMLVILFGLINILNTMISKMLSRSKELALLEAVGMDNRQIQKMLIYECVYLSAPSAVLSLILGGFGGFLLITALFESGVTYLTYQFPLAAALLYLLFCFGLPIWIALTLNHSFQKQNLMERLKIME